MKITRLLALAGVATLSIGALSACSSSNTDSNTSTTLNSELDVQKYEALIASAPVATDEQIEANEWAKAVKKAGTLRVGGVNTSTLFSLESVNDYTVRGFDAGLSQLLAHYILGDNATTNLTTVTSSTREEVLVNGSVDLVVATYSITEERKEKIDFAGPYFVAQQGILVARNNNDITSVEDLAGKKVAVQAGSTGPSILAEYAPDADVKEYQTDEEIQEALAQGRVDAYVVDNTLLASAVVERPEDFKIAGEPFGPEDPYGIGVPKGSDAKEFVNAFLKTIEDKGIWEELWHITIGDRTGQNKAPAVVQLEAGVAEEKAQE